MLNKSQLIESIQQINRSAQTSWLSSFDIAALRNYLTNLQRTLEPRGPESSWTRLGDTPPVVERQCRF